MGSLCYVQGTFKPQLKAHMFRATWKFLSCQVLLVMTFWQKPIMFLLKRLGCTKAQANLFYSALLGWECMLVALMNCRAWRPEEPWYEAAAAGGASAESEEDGASYRLIE